MNKKVIIATAFVSVVMTLLVTHFVFKENKQNNNPANWALPEKSVKEEIEPAWGRYENTEKKFALDYPTNLYSPRLGDVTEPDIISFDSIIDYGRTGGTVHVTEAVYEDIEEQFANLLEHYTPVTLGGVEALKQISQYGEATYYAIYNQHLYVLVFADGEIGERMVESWEFLE